MVSRGHNIGPKSVLKWYPDCKRHEMAWRFGIQHSLRNVNLNVLFKLFLLSYKRENMSILDRASCFFKAMFALGIRYQTAEQTESSSHVSESIHVCLCWYGNRLKKQNKIKHEIRNLLSTYEGCCACFNKYNARYFFNAHSFRIYYIFSESDDVSMAKTWYTKSSPFTAKMLTCDKLKM